MLNLCKDRCKLLTRMQDLYLHQSSLTKDRTQYGAGPWVSRHWLGDHLLTAISFCLVCDMASCQDVGETRVKRTREDNVEQR